MTIQRARPIALAIACVASWTTANAQLFDFPAAAGRDSAVLTAYMPHLAAEVLAVYHEGDRGRYLDNLFRIQSVAGRYAEAGNALDSLRVAPGNRGAPEAQATRELYAILATAMQGSDGITFDDAFREAFRSRMRVLDDRTSALLIRSLSINQRVLEGALRVALRQQQEKQAISLADALRLIKAYQTRQAFRTIAPLVEPLVVEDDRRRYIIEANVQVRTPDGATVCTMVVRQRSAPARLPTLLNFTIYADTTAKLIDARRAASNGYVGVVGYTRGKLCSPDVPVPYEYDGADAAALIDWISRQPWSDGRVGMYGGSYEGFTQWATAKHMPRALKTIIPAVPVAPGLDVPMEGNVFVNFVYPWPFYATNVRALDDDTYNDFARWNRLSREWYVSGRAYRELDKIDGTPNPIFDRWISHPTYDAYWQRMIPYREEFARIKIPVLATAGYFYGGPGAALYYFTEHYKHDPAANHYLVVGPYDHVPGQRGVVNVLGDTSYDFAGYQLDPVALVDLWHLRYEWFDYIFKSAPKPALLADKVNYQVMGANVWKHAPSIAAMAAGKMRFYLTAVRNGDAYRMSGTAPRDGAAIAESVDFANRADIDRIVPGGGIVADAVDTVDAVAYVSDPLNQRTEVSGLFSGRLEFIINKRDFDLFVGLYALTPKGEYVLLSTLTMRASHARDLVHRQLLTPGKHERLDFRSVRLVSRDVQAGSRIVVVLGPVKAPTMQLNYGTGKDVSDETIADAREPIRIQWFGDSFVEIPTSPSP
jgi:putative CocE/NonD family hydrolase